MLKNYHKLIKRYVTGQHGEQKFSASLNHASSFIISNGHLLKEINRHSDAVVDLYNRTRISSTAGRIRTWSV